jgi:hypothetical protein
MLNECLKDTQLKCQLSTPKSHADEKSDRNSKRYPIHKEEVKELYQLSGCPVLLRN